MSASVTASRTALACGGFQPASVRRVGLPTELVPNERLVLRLVELLDKLEQAARNHRDVRVTPFFTAAAPIVRLRHARHDSRCATAHRGKEPIVQPRGAWKGKLEHCLCRCEEEAPSRHSGAVHTHEHIRGSEE